MKCFTIVLPNTSATLTAYIHEQSAEMPNLSLRPAMLVAPGGGYRMCSDREAEPVALAYYTCGYNAFVLRYTANEDRPFNKAFSDGELAIIHLRENAKEYNLIEGKLAAIGFSAGAHLVASIATTSVHKPDAMVLCYGVLNNQYGIKSGLSIMNTAQAVSSDTPPAFLFATADDDVVPCESSLEFAIAMTKNKRFFELHIFESGPHGLSLCTKETASGRDDLVHKDAQLWVELSIAFLSRNLKVQP